METPTGQWLDEQNYSPRPTFSLTTPEPGDCLVAVDVLSQTQVAAGDWSQARVSPTQAVFVDAAVQLTTSQKGVPVGNTVTVTAHAQKLFAPLHQFWVGTPNGHGGFTWRQSGSYRASATDTFTASQPGMYQVVAFAKSPDAVSDAAGALMSPVLTSVVAYGPADQVVLSAAAPTLLADGAAANPVTATVEDAEGTRVSNFNGTITVSASPAGADAVAGTAEVVAVSGIAQTGQQVWLEVSSAALSPGGMAGFVMGNDGQVSFSQGTATVAVTANAFGSASFSLALDDAEQQRLTVEDLGSHVSGTLVRQVDPGQPARLKLSGVSAGLTATDGV